MQTTCFLLMLAAFVFALRQRRRMAVCCAALSAALFLLVGYGPLARWLTEGLQAPYAEANHPAWAATNAIVVLGAGVDVLPGARAIEPGVFAKDRIMEGALQYRACHAAGRRCTLLLSGGDPKHHGAAEAAVYRDYLLKLGVAADDIVLESHSLNTWQNAQMSTALLAQLKPEQVVVVTSGIHLHRALMMFELSGIHAVPVRSDYPSAVHSALPQAYNFLLADRALHEYAGAWQFHLYNLLGLNRPK